MEDRDTDNSSDVSDTEFMGAVLNISALDKFPNFDEILPSYERVIDGFFENKRSLESLTAEGERIDSQPANQFYSYTVWFTLEALAERVMSGKNPDSFKNKFYKVAESLKKDNLNRRAFRKLFPNKSPVAFFSEDINFFDFSDDRNLEKIFNVLSDPDAIEEPKTLADAFYKIVGPEKKGIIGYMRQDEMGRSEFAHCVRIAKYADRLTKDKQTQDMISAAYLSHAIHLFHPGYLPEDRRTPEYEAFMASINDAKKMLQKYSASIAVYDERGKEVTPKLPDFVSR